MDAERIIIDTDEDGFYLIIESDDEWPLDFGPIRLTNPEALYDAVKAVIGPWLRERDERRAFAQDAIQDAYDIQDPKHPDFHSIHADLYDQEGDR